MLTITMKLKLLGLAAKNGVEITKFLPGHLVLTIDNWDEHEAELLQLIEELEATPEILEIQIAPKTVDIQYNPDALENARTIDTWLGIFDKYSFI